MKKETIGLYISGCSFALLWASASAATRIALQAAQPFVIAVTRFFIAAAIMLFVAHVLLRKRLPQKEEWKQIAIYGFLNVSIYLGLYVIAMQHVSAGLGTLSVATNPVFISLMAALWIGRPVKKYVMTSLLLCITGIAVVAWPLVKTNYASATGIIVLLLSMIAYSAGAVYFSAKKWNQLHILVINGWQTLIGGVFLLPLMVAFFDPAKNTINSRSVAGILWLAVPVSIGAVQLWLLLLRKNPVSASFWLFLCPPFGFIIALLLLNEPLYVHTFTGMLLVIAGLYITQRHSTD